MKRIVVFILVLLASLAPLFAAEFFPGEKSDCHGCALYSVQIGGETAQVLVPEKPAAGRPWVLAAQLYNLDSATVGNMTRTEIELVKRGFHVVVLGIGNTFGALDAIAKYDAVYRDMTGKFGLARQVALMGLSREGLSIARWAAANPGKVTCLYMDKAVTDFKSWPGGKIGVGKGSPSDWESLQKLYGFNSEAEAMAYKWNPIDLAPKLAAHKVAILYLAGEKDEAVPFEENGGKLQSEYKRLGGVFELIMHSGEGHHPHGSPDPRPVVDFIERHSVGSKTSPSPGLSATLTPSEGERAGVRIPGTETSRIGTLNRSEKRNRSGAGFQPASADKLSPLVSTNGIPSGRLEACPTTPRLMGRGWQPVPGHIMTPWAADVNPRAPLPDYPRPQLVRKEWINLNGLWDYAIQPMDLPKPDKFSGKILVPYPVESALSGVKKPVWKDERLWYRRTFKAPKIASGERLLLHFGAVDWEAKVFVNGKAVGEHRGGFDAFTFDITDALKPGAENELVVAVFDATGAGQAIGKQNYNKYNKPGGIAYTACSGIWQTVWMETVEAAHIENLKLISDVDAGCLRVTVTASDEKSDRAVEIVAMDGKKEIARASVKSGVEFNLPIPNARLWSPDDPFLYNLKVRMGGDEVTSYFGMRKIALGKDEKGFTTMLLNGKPVFQAGPLDQGFWPDGIYTAPTDEALRWDIEETKRLGFNMTRKHVKIEPARWYYWCDKLGLLVWQDMPSGGGGNGGDREKEGQRGDEAVARQFESELRTMIEQHWSHPSVIMWVVFNEAWGQYDTARLTQEVRQLDPSRIVNSASGWADIGVGDLHDHHTYPGPSCPEPEGARAAVLGEFGGLGLTTPGHTWVETAWGYRGVVGERSLTRKYVELWRGVWQLKKQKGLCAAVYTQWTDIETEGNGLYTYDRKRLKVDAKQVADAHQGVFAPPTIFDVVAPTAQDETVSWRYTTEQPAGDWAGASFDDAIWRVGAAGFGAASFTNVTVRTHWETGDIWLRRAVVLPQGKLHFPALKIFHGQETEVFLNGVLAAKLNGRGADYDEFDIKPEAAKTIHPGVNQLAVHCRRGKQAQFIDVGLVQERRSKPER